MAVCPAGLTGTSPGLHRDLTVVPLIGDKRYYGEDPMRLRCGYGVVVGGQGKQGHSTQNSENPKTRFIALSDGRVTGLA
jgi:hypothetical protein